MGDAPSECCNKIKGVNTMAQKFELNADVLATLKEAAESRSTCEFGIIASITLLEIPTGNGSFQIASFVLNNSLEFGVVSFQNQRMCERIACMEEGDFVVVKVGGAHSREKKDATQSGGVVNIAACSNFEIVALQEGVGFAGSDTLSGRKARAFTKIEKVTKKSSLEEAMEARRKAAAGGDQTTKVEGDTKEEPIP
jgi:hypothetical protein